MIVVSADPAWSTLVSGGLGVAGAEAVPAPVGAWAEAFEALRRGEIERLVLLEPSLVPRVTDALRGDAALARKIVWRAPGLQPVAGAPGVALGADSTLDELVVAVLGPPESVAFRAVELSLEGVAMAALLGAAAVLRPTLKITLTTPEGTAALCLCGGLVRAAGIAESPLAESEGLAEDPSLTLLMKLWTTSGETGLANRLHADLGFVCEYGDLFAESEAHQRHVTRVLTALLQREGVRASFEPHEPATRGRDLVLALRDACRALPDAALDRLVPGEAQLIAPAGLPARLRDALPPPRYGRLFFLLEDATAVDAVVTTARLPRPEAVAALAVGLQPGALRVVRGVDPPPIPPPLDTEDAPLAPRTRRRERIATVVAASGQALASSACGDARRFIDGLQIAATQALEAGRRLRLRGTRFEPVGELVEHLVLGYRIGAGGMGDVLLGVLGSQADVLKVVAVKRRGALTSRDPERLEMFLAEARLSASLAHPNIVQTHQLLRNEGQYLLVMEFVHGLSGAELVARLGDEALSAGLVAWIGAEVARGLHYAHHLEGPDGTPLGLVHRDVAPANVMFGLDGGVKLIDFGVAGARSERHHVTDLRRRTGRLSYMAPEAVLGQRVGPETDQYALGVTLYELLTLKRPFVGQDDHSPIEATLSGQHRPLLEARPDIPAALAYAVERAMSVRPHERFRDCDALRQALLAATPPAGDVRDQVADLVRRLARDVMPYEIEAIARLRRAAAALLVGESSEGAGSPFGREEDL